MSRIRRTIQIPRFTRRHVEREIDDELAFHIAKRTERLIAEGMQPGAARAEAERRFGDPSRVRGECLHADTAEWRKDRLEMIVDQTIGDIRFAIRSMRRAPAFTAVVLTTLTLGIALLGAIFSYFDAVYFGALPYRDADRIVALSESRPSKRFFSFTAVSLDAVQLLRRETRSFERLSAYDRRSPTVVFGNDPTQLNTLAVDTAFIPLFALQPELGRLIAPEEIGAHAAVMMISDVLWRTRFGAVPDVVGRFVDLAGIHYRIVGVMPEGFRFPYQTDAIVPLVERADSGTTTRDTYVALIGKLRRGVTRSAARTEMSVLAHHLGAIDAKEYAGATIEVRDEMLDRQARNFLPAPTLFLGAGMFLLLIACANVGNLFYVRTAERRTEMAIRASLGAGSGRLLRQALTETAMLSAIASVLGVTFAEVLVRVWLHVIPTQGFPSWFHLGLDWHILAFAIVVTSVVTMAAGLAPAREGTRFDLVRTLKGSDAGASSPNVSRGSKRGVVLQLALSMTLFVASALLVRSYRHLTKMDVGYPASSIATVDPLYDAVRYPQQSLRTDFADRILERAATMPGVTHAAVRGRFFGLRNDPASHVKRSAPSMERYDTHLIPDADSSRRVDPGRNHAEYVVSDDYFNVMGLHLRAGRAFTAADVAGAPTAVVVSARAASLLWGNRPAVGHTVQIGRFGDPLNVVGVVDNVRPLRGGWDGFHSDAEATFYLSERQALSMYPNILARAKSNAAPVHEEIANLVRRADPKLILLRDVTLANDLDEAHLITRVFGGIITALALSALLLSMIGIYGVVAFGVEQRRREIGVRIALGGTVRDVTRLIMGEAARLVGLGLVVGLVLATGAARLLKSFLFEVSAIDPMAYAATAVLFGGIALLASWLPALRVARVDPVAALRSE